MVIRTIQRDVVGAFILSSDNRLLLGKAAVYTGYWGVPGGGIDEGETKLEALHREVLEETGLDIRNAEVRELEGVATGSSEKTLRETGERVNVEMNFYDFLVRLRDSADQVAIVAEDDFTDARWVELGELGTIALTPPSTQRLKRLGFLQE